MLVENGIPRRSNTLRWIPAEKAVYDLTQQIEVLGCHPLLTDAVILLSQVREKIADWAEETGNISPVKP
jgi:hypothetical protein